MLEFQHGIHQFYKYLFQIVISFPVFLTGLAFVQSVQQCHGVPSQGSEPEIPGKPRLPVTPEHFPAGIISVIIQPRLPVPHILYHIGKLAENVIVMLPLIEFGLIFHIKGLPHIHTVQPHLVGIDLLVPEIPLCRPGLGLNLGINQVDGPAVFLPAVYLIQGKESFSCVHIVNIVLLHPIPGNRAVLHNPVVDESICKFIVLLLPRGPVYFQKCQDHAAVYVIPPGFQAGPGFLNIPGGHVQCALLQEFVNIFFKYRHLHPQFLLPFPHLSGPQRMFSDCSSGKYCLLF